MSNKQQYQARELAKRERIAERNRARANKARSARIHDSAYKALMTGKGA